MFVCRSGNNICLLFDEFLKNNAVKKLLLLLTILFLKLTAIAQSLKPCSKGSLYGFCDESGTVKIQQVFQNALSFRGNLAPVLREDSYWWFVNKKGHLMFNSRQTADQAPPNPQKGLYIIKYFDPIFADVTEYYNDKGLPVKVESDLDFQSDTLPYTMFSAIKAIELAKSKLGTPYGLDNLDCSGFMRFIFAPFGIVLPYYAREIAQKGREISKVEIREGDLVFYGGGSGREQTVNHVGMVISVNKADFEFIHSSTSKGISTNKSADNYYKLRFLFARRIFDF